MLPSDADAHQGSSYLGLIVDAMTEGDARDQEPLVNELEQLAAQDPDCYTHLLAWALGLWGDHLWDLGLPDDYLRAYEEAAHVVRLRVDAGIATEQEASDLPQHVGNVASVAYRIGQLDVARAAADEALTRESALAGAPRPEQWDSEAFVARMTALLADATIAPESAPHQIATTAQPSHQGGPLT